MKTRMIIVHIDRLPGFIDELLDGGGSVISIVHFDDANRELWYRADDALADRIVFNRKG
jgi:hypothetical protein